MNKSRRVQLIAMCVLALSLLGSGALTTMIASSQGANELTYTDRAEDGDPPEIALGIAIGALRGLIVNYLWIRATDAKEEGRYYEAVELSRWITKLQPRLPRVWTFHSWNMAYNISVTTNTPSERWSWVNAGVNILRDEGLRINPNDMHMHKELGWIFLHKIGGYTDDSNQYYKRQFAYEWHSVMGAPPTIAAENRDADSVKEIYAQWLDGIVRAPATRQGLAQRSPKAEAIAKDFESTVGEPIGKDLLRRYALDNAMQESFLLVDRYRNAGPKTRAFRALREKHTDEQAWTDLVNHARQRVLIEEYNMEPLRMAQQTRKFGPIDWRLPAAHSLYWSARGTDVGLMEVSEHNSDSLDFVNAYRIVMQSVQELWRYGELYFNYIDVHEDRYAYYQVVPNPNFVPAYGQMLEEVVENSGRFEQENNAYRPFAAGFENFLRDVIRFYYRRGNYTEAERWFAKLRTWGGHNINDPDRQLEMTLTLKEFADKQLYDSMGSPQVAVSEVNAALYSAYIQGLLFGNDEVFRGQWDYARKAHAYFFSEQFNEVAGSTITARMEFMDRDFRFLAGNMFVNVIMRLPPSEAELLYSYAPDDLKRFSYDVLVGRYKGFIDELSSSGESKTFAQLFPEPDGMPAFRTWFAAEIEKRSGAGINRNVRQN
jgi:hypothetical protein